MKENVDTVTDIDAKALTSKITAGAKLWLLNAGVKPVEEEVEVEPGWVADLAGFIHPTPTELKKAWKINRIMECPNTDTAIHRFYARYEMPLTVLVEVKVSTADYKKDLGRKYHPFDTYKSTSPAHLSYLAIPSGIVDDRALPYGWGLILFAKDGSKILKVNPPSSIDAQHQYETTRFVSAVAMRCYNKWTFREFRESVKRYRANQAESEKRWKLAGILRACIDTARSGRRSLSEELKYQGVDVPKHLEKMCEELEQVMKGIREHV